MRYLLITILAMFVVGCGSAATSQQDYKPMAASAITLAVFKKPAPPVVKPDADKCPDCDGKGKVGDGTVMVTCKTCNGTGKTGYMPPEPPGEAVTHAQCVDGVCTPCSANCDQYKANASTVACADGCENGACVECNSSCPQCVSGSAEVRYVRPRLFGRWRR